MVQTHVAAWLHHGASCLDWQPLADHLVSDPRIARSLVAWDGVATIAGSGPRRWHAKASPARRGGSVTRRIGRVQTAPSASVPSLLVEMEHSPQVDVSEFGRTLDDHLDVTAELALRAEKRLEHERLARRDQLIAAHLSGRAVATFVVDQQMGVVDMNASAKQIAQSATMVAVSPANRVTSNRSASAYSR